MRGLTAKTAFRLRESNAHGRIRLACLAALALLMMLLVFECVGLESLSSDRVLSGREVAGVRGAQDARPSIAAWQAVIARRSLFKPATPLPARRTAEQSVTRIQGLLSLHMVMERGGERIAYIRVQGQGMKSFRAGEGVDEMFKVTRVDPDGVELEIVGERVALGL